MTSFNDYSASIMAIAALITALGTLGLAFITYFNISADRNSRRSDKEKEIVVKALNNALQLVVCSSRIVRSDRVSSGIACRDGIAARNRDIQVTEENRAMSLYLDLIATFCLMPREFHTMIDQINSDLPMVASYVGPYPKFLILQRNLVDKRRIEIPPGGIDGKSAISTLMDYSDFKAEIELNLKNVLRTKQFSLKNFKWEKRKADTPSKPASNPPSEHNA